MPKPPRPEPSPSPRPAATGNIVIGLLGGVASGKSTVARMFAERGFVVLDADQEARQVTAEPGVVAAIVARFGAAVAPAGLLDRAALAKIVFADATARADLEAIVHPAVRARLTERLDSALADGHSVLLDVPLLLEGGLIARCDTCVFVDASEPVRRARARARGWDDAELARREAAQTDLSVKRARCPHRISTHGNFEDVRRQVDAVLERLGRRMT
ncbi:MAG: dephospho-CoA kinase [Planctomycetota bacterium]